MAFEQKENTGSLFPNNKTKETQPDMKGAALINGVTYEIAAWHKVSKNGKEYLTLKYSVKNATMSNEAYSKNLPQPSQPAQSEDDLPF